MLNLKATMQTGYNGWSVYVADDEGYEPDNVPTEDQALCSHIEAALPDITYEAYDEDGDVVGDPEDFEDEVRAKVAELVGGREYKLTIEYDNFSS